MELQQVANVLEELPGSPTPFRVRRFNCSDLVEVQVEICRHLPTIRDVVRCGLVSRYWHEVSLVESLWKHQHMAHFGSSDISSEKVSAAFPPKQQYPDLEIPKKKGMSWHDFVVKNIKRYDAMNSAATRVTNACADNFYVLVPRLILHQVSSLSLFKYAPLFLPPQQF